MALATNVILFRNTDFDYVYTIYSGDEQSIIQVTTWTISWMLKKFAQDIDADSIITKTTADDVVVSGTFNSDPDVNTEVVTVSIEDTDTDTLQPGDYFWELKRTDDGNETVLAYGVLSLRASLHVS